MHGFTQHGAARSDESARVLDLLARRLREALAPRGGVPAA